MTRVHESRGQETVAELMLDALRRIMRAMDLRSRFLVTRYGLTVPQLAVLQALARGGPVSIGRLTGAVHVSQATVTGILDRLEARGLIRRDRGHQDKRRVWAALTPEGEEMVARAPSLLQESFTAELERLPDWERTQVLSSLQRVAAMLEASHQGVVPSERANRSPDETAGVA